MAKIDLDQICENTVLLKQDFRQKHPYFEKKIKILKQKILEKIEIIEDKKSGGRRIIPELKCSEILSGKVSEDLVQEIKNSGAIVVREVFPKQKAKEWFQSLEEYVEENDYFSKQKEGLDRYFSDLKSDRPQIYGIYWSKAQIEARQDESMAKTRSFLNRIWDFQSHGTQYFHPDRECTYADRIRMRQPGDQSLGLSPHMDSGSVERWLDPAYRKTYRSLFETKWEEYDPYSGVHRSKVEGIDSPAVCRAFRTWQGWTALSRQGPGDGTLQLIPCIDTIAYVLMRPMLEDVPEEILCGAEPGKAQAVTDEWHSLLLRGLVSIPEVEPGDTVWWHSDVIHGVEEIHHGDQMSSVIYIGAAPWCGRNQNYLERQKPCFVEGRSSPDFAAEDYEKDFIGRAISEDLSPLGRKQMGFESW
ncbi:MAG TPA: DUF1479 family protein [SAR324 cluster bacterium]|nr:DUF1479 family protein [SAR324 cluster bacterium]